MDPAAIVALTGLAAAVGAGMTKLLDFFLAKGKLQADVTVTQAKTDSEIELNERLALNQEWAEIRKELKGDNDRLRTEQDRVATELKRVFTQLDQERQARSATDDRLRKVEAELLEAIAGRDYLERKLRRLETYVDLLLDVMRHHGIAPPRMHDHEEEGT